MQIMHYCARLRLTDGGVVRAVLDLTTALSRCGKQVTLMSTEGSDWPHSEDGVETMQTGSFDRAPIRFSSNRLKLLAQHIDAADVLHLHTPWEPANVQLAKIARTCGTPYVISVHGMLDDWVMKTSRMKKRIFLKLGGRKMFHRAAATHCTAQAEADQAKKWIRKASINVIPLVFNPMEYLNPPPTADPDKYWPQRESNRQVVLFLSRLHPKKGIERLLHAASTVSKSHNVRFIIAGSGETAYEQHLKSLSRELELNNIVEFVGFVEGDRKTALLRAADLFVLPTSQENFGLVFPEAMACGLPVITTKGVDIWQELQQSGGAIIIDDRADQLTSSIISLLDDDSKRISVSKAAKKWLASTFMGDAVVNRYIELYRQMMNE